MGGISPLILMGAIFAAFWFLLIRPMKQKEKKERESLFSSLKKNDEVLTASGIIGIVAQVKDDEVVLKVDESANVAHARAQKHDRPHHESEGWCQGCPASDRRQSQSRQSVGGAITAIFIVRLESLTYT